MKNQILASLLTVAIITGCNTQQTQSTNSDITSHAKTGHSGHHMPGVDERTIELMAIHDSIMPAMGTLMELKRKVTAEIKTTDSLIVVKSSSALKSRKDQAIRIGADLEKAENEMMGWMHQYKTDTLETLDSLQASAYISDQTKKIETVRDQMKKSIAEAKGFIEKK